MLRYTIHRRLAFSSSFKYSVSKAYSTKKSTPKTSSIHDVVIIGGGPAGLTLASSLCNSAITKDLSVALIEGSDLDKIRCWNLPNDKYENRVSSLTPKSRQFLESIGAWDCLKQERIQQYEEMKVWDGCSGARIEFSSHLGENADIAYMVENFNLQQGLLKSIDESKSAKNVKILSKSRVKSIEYGQNTSECDLSSWPVVELESGEKTAARLLIGADGANSPVRTFAGIESRGWNYDTHGLVATLQLEWEDFRTIAWQRFLPTGPIAMLPLPNGFASLVWSTTPERAQHLKSLSNEDFVAMVNAGFRLRPADLNYLHKLNNGIVEEVEWRLENTEIIDEDNNCPIPVQSVLENTRASFPLKMKHADTYVAERIALIGDAAHSAHPLAGQGLNMGQSDVANLSHTLQNAVRRGQDIGSLLSLESYWKASYFKNHVKLGVFDKLHKLYGTSFEPIVQLRSLGLNAVNSSELLKKFLISQASQ